MKRFVTLLVLLGLTGVAYAQAPGANIDTGSAITILEQQTMALMKYQHADFKDVALSKNSNPDGAASYFLCGGSHERGGTASRLPEIHLDFHRGGGWQGIRCFR